MFPLYDEHRPTKTSIVTIGLIFVNILIFLFSFSQLETLIAKYGMFPENILAGKELFTIFTSMFMHAGIFHLIGNMWFLWVFGNNLEAAMGKFRYLIFYLLCGFLASFFYVFLATQKTIPVVGASGAISGVLGGYFLLFPQHKIKSIVPIIFFITIISVPAIIFLVLWVLFQIFLPVEGVATAAHLIGFLAGIILVKPFKKR
jgi:membrane associated rhomboid family serine protease